MQSVLKLVVFDGQGVMDRIAGLVRRHGCNISSVSAGEVADGLSDIVIAFHTKGVDMEILGKRLSDLDCVKQWEECTQQSGLLREMVLGSATGDHWPKIESQGARLLEQSGDKVYFEYSGTTDSVEEFIRTLRELGVRCTRSGPVCLSKSSKEE